MNIEVRGAEQLAALSKKLKQVGDRDLQREFNKAITAATKPVKPAFQREALRVLPKRGGLARRVSKARVTTKRRTGAKIAGVRVVASSPDALRQIDRTGVIRHPVHGHRDVWVTQQVPQSRGVWTRPTEALRDDIQRALVGAMNDVARKIGRSL